MKTSLIEVHDMLSVLSVEEVEKRIGKVAGVESVTVNYTAGSATVRYDETRLKVADIKPAVRQLGQPSAATIIAINAKGSAKIECANLIESRMTARRLNMAHV